MQQLTKKDLEIAEGHQQVCLKMNRKSGAFSQYSGFHHLSSRTVKLAGRWGSMERESVV